MLLMLFFHVRQAAGSLFSAQGLARCHPYYSVDFPQFVKTMWKFLSVLNWSGGKPQYLNLFLLFYSSDASFT